MRSGIPVAPPEPKARKSAALPHKPQDWPGCSSSTSTLAMSTSRIVTFASGEVHKAVLVGILIGVSALLGYPRPPDGSAAPPLSSGAVAESPLLGSAGSPVTKGQVKANGITIAYESFGPRIARPYSSLWGLVVNSPRGLLSCVRSS
jgi:hypothetical protein